MADRIPDILDEYDFDVRQTFKVRGAIIADTDKGLKTIKEYKGSGHFIEDTQKHLVELNASGRFVVDAYVANKEGEYITKASDQQGYIVKEWYECRDCDIKQYGDVIRIIETLAMLHTELNSHDQEPFKYIASQPDIIMEKHNMELMKIKKYLLKKNNKNSFETMSLKYFDMFFKEAEEALSAYKNCEFKKAAMGICHGNYNYHNVLFGEELPVVVNFEKMHYDYLMSDLYLIARKIMEKYDWSIVLGHEIINAYHRIKSINEDDIKYLSICFSYPEKFWKIMNTYFNSKKTWVPEKNCEKLEKLIGQNKRRLEFINTII